MMMTSPTLTTGSKMQWLLGETAMRTAIHCTFCIPSKLFFGPVKLFVAVISYLRSQLCTLAGLQASPALTFAGGQMSRKS